ncbi:D-lactate dehydrogenase [Streptomyces laurentii]|uniref:D-lactate dehydrogenase n=1 Tax=Streptomyces laurentii TaxID=39478 RepID=A0A160NYV6_STRLU|nr:D-lactate dehydrogenase [Streptomyces laurentii]
MATRTTGSSWRKRAYASGGKVAGTRGKGKRKEEEGKEEEGKGQCSTGGLRDLRRAFRTRPGWFRYEES